MDTQKLYRPIWLDNDLKCNLCDSDLVTETKIWKTKVFNCRILPTDAHRSPPKTNNFKYIFTEYTSVTCEECMSMKCEECEGITGGYHICGECEENIEEDLELEKMKMTLKLKKCIPSEFRKLCIKYLPNGCSVSDSSQYWRNADLIESLSRIVTDKDFSSMH